MAHRAFPRAAALSALLLAAFTAAASAPLSAATAAAIAADAGVSSSAAFAAADDRAAAAAAAAEDEDAEIDADADEAVAAAEDAADAALAAACEADNAGWRALLAAYAQTHARGLAALEAGAAAVAALPPARRPRLSVYIVRPRESQVGLGDIVAGLSNVFLSALRRGRVLLVEWEGSEAALGQPRAPFLATRTTRARWERLALALGPRGANRTEAHWSVVRGEVQGDARSWPPLWGRGRGKTLETHAHFNRGAFTPDGGAPAGSDPTALGWLERSLPRAPDGGLAYGCVYRAVFSIRRRLRVRAAQRVRLPPPPPPPPSPPPAPTPATAAAATATTAPPAAGLLCAHIRTWVFSPELPRESAEIVRNALRCTEHLLRARDAGDRGRGAGGTGTNATLLYVASDNDVAREAFRARFGARRVLSIPDAPAHIAYKFDASPAAIGAALESTVLDWHLLSRCHGGTVLATNTGFSRTASAAAQAPLFFWRRDEDVEAADDGGVPCSAFAGKGREVNRGVGCGW